MTGNLYTMLKMCVSREYVPLWNDNEDNEDDVDGETAGLLSEMKRHNDLIQSLDASSPSTAHHTTLRQMLSTSLRHHLPTPVLSFVQQKLRLDVIHASLRMYSTMKHEETEYLKLTDANIIEPPNVSFNEWATDLLMPDEHEESKDSKNSIDRMCEVFRIWSHALK